MEGANRSPWQVEGSSRSEWQVEDTKHEGTGDGC
jgi:hypothetical protein